MAYHGFIAMLLLALFSCQPQEQNQSNDAPPTEHSFLTMEHQLSFPTATSSVDSPRVRGFQEILISVRDLEVARDFYLSVTGWSVLSEQVTDQEQLRFWQLGDKVSARSVVLHNPGDVHGYMRLIEFQNVDQVPIRAHPRPWDSGGIFDFNMRAVDIIKSTEQFMAFGWNGHAGIQRYQFGPFDVSEVVLQGPDGVSVALMQRHAPPLEGYPNLKKLSQVFNATHISKDAEAAYDFFVNKLGFKVYLQTEGKDRKAGPNVLGIPQNTNAEIEMPVFIVHPEGNNFGSVEFLEMKGLDGADFSHLAHPPNLGILMQRFPVDDAQAYADLLQERGLKLKTEVQEIFLAPYGQVKLFAIQSPDGVWLEFIELVE